MAEVGNEAIVPRMPVANRRISADTSLATAQGRATKLAPVG